MLIVEQGRAFIKKDWTAERIGRAHRDKQTITQADEFVQTLMLPSTLPPCKEPQPVEVLPNVDKLVDFLSR